MVACLSYANKQLRGLSGLDSLCVIGVGINVDT